MGRESKGQLSHCGRVISAEELADILETVATCSRLSRSELALTICEHLEWQSASGSLKLDACSKLLEKLETQGVLKLPEKQISSGWSSKQIIQTERTEAGELLEGNVGALGPFQVVPVTEKDEIALWNEYVNRYHYLGYKQPFGCSGRYFITSRYGKLGCMLFSGAAKGLRERDKWLGWSKDERLRNLGLVTNNSRFLIFPWVKVKYLASHALGQAVRRLGDDWQQRWGYRPVVVETFVDPEHYAGTCYRAANWLYLGDTTGTGLPRQGKSYTSSPKKIFVLPLASDFRMALRSNGEPRP
jgi:hypothetical protein